MRMVNFIVPIGVNSFYYSVKYAISWIDPSMFYTSISSGYVMGRLNILVDDMWNIFRKPSKSNIYWVDTPLWYDMDRVPLQRYNPREVWVASTWNLEVCRKYFGDKCKYQPRVIHPLYMYDGLRDPAFNYEKQYDMAFIGVCWWRKYCREFKRICRELNLKCWMTGNYDTMSMFDIINRLKRTKLLWWITGAEGFGLPLMEAQVLGVVPVCIDAHANKDYCYTRFVSEDYLVKPTGRMEKDDITGFHKVWTFDYNEAKRLIDYMVNMDENEYKLVANQVYYMSHSTINTAVDWLTERLRKI